MDKNLLVQIVVPVGKQKWEIGTGYPVAKDRILTAHHVLFPEQRNKDRKIELRWYHLSGAAKEWQEIADDCVIWTGDDKYDVAIIKHPFPEIVNEWGILSDDKSTTNEAWESRGFASAGKLKNDTQEPVDLKGTIYSMADNDTSFVLGVDHEVQKEEYWKGASGSPVFVDHKILGVIISCPPKFDGSRFRATPAWQLLQQDGFRIAIGYSKREDRLKNTKHRLVKILNESLAVQKEFSKQLNFPLNGGTVEVGGLVDQLLDSSLDKLLSMCDSSVEKMHEEAEKTAVSVIQKVTSEILPVIFGEGIIERVKAHKSEVNPIIVSLPINTYTAAEIIMAGFDNRETKFKPLLSEELYPEGKFSLPLFPEAGNNTDQGQSETDFHQQMRGFAGSDLLKQSSTVNESRIIKAAAKELEYLSTRKKRTYYVLCRQLAENSSNNNFISKMKKAYSALIFIELNENEDFFDKERDQFRPLKDIFTSEV